MIRIFLKDPLRASIQLTGAQLIKITESIGAVFPDKASFDPKQAFQIEENATVQTAQGEYYGTVLYAFIVNLTLEISATLLEFDEAPYIRAAQHNAQINNNKDLYQDDFEQLTNKYSHYTDLQINVACGFRRNGPEYYYHIDTMKVYDSMGELFDLINDTQKAMSVMGGCSMTVTKLYKSNIWEVRSTEEDIVTIRYLIGSSQNAFYFILTIYMMTGLMMQKGYIYKIGQLIN